MIEPIFLFLAFILFFGWIVLFNCGCRKACPDCKNPLPRIQSPFTKTRRQWIKGGYLCPNCGCETDIRGVKVSEGTAPQPLSIIAGMVPPLLAALLAVTLLVIILQRPSL